MPNQPKQITISFAGINFPGPLYGFPYEVNQLYTMSLDHKSKTYRYQSPPDADGIYASIVAGQKWQDQREEWKVNYELYKAGGAVVTYPFSGQGISPVQNILPATGTPYGGTATIT